LASRQLLDYLAALHGYALPADPSFFPLNPDTVFVTQTFSDWCWFLIVGQSLMSLLLAFCGGMLAKWIYNRSERPAADSLAACPPTKT
jgi:hypothetical protein